MQAKSRNSLTILLTSGSVVTRGPEKDHSVLAKLCSVLMKAVGYTPR